MTAAQMRNAVERIKKQRGHRLPITGKPLRRKPRVGSALHPFDDGVEMAKKAVAEFGKELSKIK